MKNQSVTKGTIYFNNFFNYRTKPWFANKKLPREAVVIVNRCRSGHHSLASSLNKIDINESARCQCGYEIQDVNHILWQCPLFDINRQNFVKKLRKQEIFLPMTFTSLLSNPTAKLCETIYRYIKSCEIII